jgi:hypothetical protein
MPAHKPHADVNLYQCNPNTLMNTTRTTCLPVDMLERLRAEWNKRHPENPIPRTTNKKEALWAELRERMKSQYKCDTEYCSLQELGTAEMKTAGASFFRPKKPSEWLKDPREWHDTLTIARVMQQYEDAIPFFEFIGPVPMDFDSMMPGSFNKCVVDELCGIDLAALKARGEKYVGIVFNLDPHYKPGSHWVCAFIDLVRSAAYYYDSYGYPPCTEIKRLMTRCKEQGCTQLYWNDIRHQKKKSECGTYCMYVILSLLGGRTFKDICENPVDDDTMNALRDILYATERPSSLAIHAVAKLLRMTFF